MVVGWKERSEVTAPGEEGNCSENQGKSASQSAKLLDGTTITFQAREDLF